MRRLAWMALGFLALAGCGDASAPFGDGTDDESAVSRPPNIILIIADDLAWDDLGFMGSEHVSTPRLDALASEATVFPNGYGTASVCVPSLRSLLTGLDPYQWKSRAQEIALRSGELTPRLEQTRLFETLPERLAAAGYTSFQAGKLWEASYQLAGFDAGTMTELDITRRNGRREKLEVPIGRTTMEPLLDFIDEQDARGDGPFFIWFAPQLPHAPYDAPAQFRRPYMGRGYARTAVKYFANITRFDAAVGELLDHLAARDIDDETLLVFLSDNGWDQPPFEVPKQQPPDDWDGPKGKRSMYDKGFRTPAFFHLAGRVPPVVEPALVSTLDVVATLFDYGGVAPPAGLTGRTLRPMLEGAGGWERDIVGAMVRPRRGAPARGTPDYQHWVNEPGAYFVRSSQWHYIHRPFTDEHELYDVRADPREENDLAATHPTLTRRFRRQIETWKKEVEREAVAFAEEAVRRPRAPAERRAAQP